MRRRLQFKDGERNGRWRADEHNSQRLSEIYLAATEIDLSDFYHKVKSLQSDSDLIDNLFLAERLGNGPMNRVAEIGILSTQDHAIPRCGTLETGPLGRKTNGKFVAIFQELKQSRCDLVNTDEGVLDPHATDHLPSV